MTDQTDATVAPPLEEWAVVEMMGHLTRVGRVSTVKRFGAELMQIEIPAGDGFVTEDVGGSSLYRVRYVSEEVARAAAARMADPRPVQPAAYRERPALEHRDDEMDDGGPY